jgi:hypothetical protein
LASVSQVLSEESCLASSASKSVSKIFTLEGQPFSVYLNYSRLRGRHARVPTSVDLVLPNKFLTSLVFNPKYGIISFTCLMFEYDQRHSNKDIQMIQKSLWIHVNTGAANIR